LQHPLAHFVETRYARDDKEVDAMAYSMDFRHAVARSYDECGSSAEVAGQHGCCASWVRRLIQQRRERGTLEPRSSARNDEQRTYDDADEARIRKLIKARPDATLAEVAEALGKAAHVSTVSRTLNRLGLPRKKSRPTPPSRIART
jgi:transposase